MSEIYGEAHRAWQHFQDTTRLADRLQEVIVQQEISEDHKSFIESRDMFFLSSVDHRGYPTCSYKGGTPGFVKVVDGSTLVFPSYDGNGMFLSLGNITANGKVGMLFIDFETPHRVRLHGLASIDENDPLRVSFPGAEMLVRVAVTEIFVNCPRYIHQYRRLQTSRYAPLPGCETSAAPQWKRIDIIQDALPRRDSDVADKLGGVITPEQYGDLLRKGEG